MLISKFQEAIRNKQTTVCGRKQRQMEEMAVVARRITSKQSTRQDKQKTLK
jgi:hypothetical protein